MQVIHDYTVLFRAIPKDKLAFALVLLLFTTPDLHADHIGAQPPVIPDAEWAQRTPQAVGMDSDNLEALADYMGGRGFISRHGYEVFTWGDPTRREDIASAAKPFYTHFLLHAYATAQIPSLDEPVVNWEPRLADLNPDLCHKDIGITWRHMANQTSGYGVQEAPGTAFAYNDWQMALLWDTLFLHVYEAEYDSVDEAVLQPLLGDMISFEDEPTMMAFGTDDRPGRIGISPRDHARFGLLYLYGGNWGGLQLIPRHLVHMATTTPVSNTIPRAGFDEAEMIDGQRTIGSQVIPGNQNEHRGSYSWLWWVNGVDAEGNRLWPSAPPDVFAALGHRSRRGLAVLPRQSIVMAWNDTRLGDFPVEPHPLNEVLRLLVESVASQDGGK